MFILWAFSDKIIFEKNVKDQQMYTKLLFIPDYPSYSLSQAMVIQFHHSKQNN